MSVKHTKSYIVRSSYIFKLFFLTAIVALYICKVTIVVAPCAKTAHSKELIQSKLPVKHIELSVPAIQSHFKPYMDFRAITDKSSQQYQLIKTWARVDSEGFLRVRAESDFNIQNDYYCIALGSYYGTSIGTKYRITLDTGMVFYGILADCKADIHTNSTNQYGISNDIVEFLIDSSRLNTDVKYYGTASVLPLFKGSIVKIERMDFIHNEVDDYGEIY